MEQSTTLTLKHKIALGIAVITAMGILMFKLGSFSDNSTQVKNASAITQKDELKAGYAYKKKELTNDYVDERQTIANTKRIETPDQTTVNDLKEINQALLTETKELESRFSDLSDDKEIQAILSESETLLQEVSTVTGKTPEAARQEIITALESAPNTPETQAIEQAIGKQDEINERLEGRLEYLFTE